MAKLKPVVINGWMIFAHPLFLEEYEGLVEKVTELQKKDPANFTHKNITKRLAAIHKLAFEIIPKDPTLSEYRQGATLGGNHKHWFRAKFYQQYRLFFRFHSESKIIVYAWVNNEQNKRAYGSKTDAYRIFEKMLNRGDPPDSWSQLLKESQNTFERLSKIVS